MTRHARNCTAGAVYTYHEKQKDTKTAGYGTLALRLGKDSVKDFDCCSLSLQPCREPVITLDGYLYDKESILEYILHEKREIARKTKEYDKQKRQEQSEKEELGEAERRSRIERFIKQEQSIVTNQQRSNPTTKDTNEAGPSKSISNMIDGKDGTLPSFWIPMLTPAAKKAAIAKPDKAIYCPMSGKPLRLKDLIPVKFTLIQDPDDKTSLIAKKNRYMCAVTHDVLGNKVPCAALKTSGNVVTLECIEKIIKKDWLDPITGDKLTEKDIIPFQMGGTGYAITNDKLLAAVESPSMQA